MSSLGSLAPSPHFWQWVRPSRKHPDEQTVSNVYLIGLRSLQGYRRFSSCQAQADHSRVVLYLGLVLGKPRYH